MSNPVKIEVDNLSMDYVWRVAPGSTIEVIEKKKGGAGIAAFSSDNDAIFIKAKDQAPVVWCLKVRNCAEAAIITMDGDDHHLHLVEMKSGLNQGKFAEALIQFEGMFLSALAVARIISIHSFKTTTCYIAFTRNLMSVNSSADPVLLKSFVGQENPVSGAQEWFTEEVSLPFSTRALLKKGSRDENNNVDFGKI